MIFFQLACFGIKPNARDTVTFVRKCCTYNNPNIIISIITPAKSAVQNFVLNFPYSACFQIVFYHIHLMHETDSLVRLLHFFYDQSAATLY